jgi:glycosyltransferase involved in cell wall biosynthesis
MTGTPNICIVIPVFNHALTVGRVVRAAKNYFPVLAVNDGCTDDTGKILAAEPGIRVVTLPQNQGKGAALRAGFAEAEKLGFTHAITIDADGQHATTELPLFAAASRRQPGALIVGVRDLVKENAPRGRRITNNLSAFWFKVQTGVPLTDTQCGYRSYPLQAVNRLRVKSQRYAYELEVMVRAAWARVPLAAQPVSADYTAATSRLSHFHPWRDTARISLLHAWLSLQTFCVPARLR